MFAIKIGKVVQREAEIRSNGQEFFVGVTRAVLEVFSTSFPLEYPEIEALVVLQRRAFRFEEVPCRMLPPTTGKSSITAIRGAS